MLCVGIDWADDHHDACLVDAASSDPWAYLALQRISHTSEGIAELLALIRSHEPEPEQVCVALETPHGLLVHALMQAGYLVYAINPKSVNRYKDRHAPTSAKDDRRDALALAHLLRTDRHRFQPITLLPKDYRLLEELCADLRQMVADQTRLNNRLGACLKSFYPQALDLFDEGSQIYLAFLKRFPDPASLSGLTQKRFDAFLAKQGYSCPWRAPALYQQLMRPALAADPAVADASKMRMQALVDQLLALREHLRAYERRIKTLFESLTDHKNVPTLPGVGSRLAPELAARLGPAGPEAPLLYGTCKRMALVGGCVPITIQSGHYRHVSFRRACDRRLRNTLRDWAGASIRNSRWAHAYYEHARARGVRHEAVLRNLADKLLGILLTLWRTGQDYDEELHIRNLKSKNVAWAMHL